MFAMQCYRGICTHDVLMHIILLLGVNAPGALWVSAVPCLTGDQEDVGTQSHFDIAFEQYRI